MKNKNVILGRILLGLSFLCVIVHCLLIGELCGSIELIMAFILFIGSIFAFFNEEHYVVNALLGMTMVIYLYLSLVGGGLVMYAIRGHFLSSIILIIYFIIYVFILIIINKK